MRERKSVKTKRLIRPYAIGTIIYIIVLPLWITMIVYGSMNIDKCPLDRFIPVWLIVIGTVFCASTLLNLGYLTVATLNRNLSSSNGMVGSFFVKILIDILFLFAWTIAGAISVYGNHSKVSFTTNRLYNYCDQVTYQFAFSIITLTWALYGLGLFMPCIMFCGSIRS